MATAVCFDLCTAEGCAGAIAQAARRHMPQLDAARLLRRARGGTLGGTLVRRALSRRLTPPQLEIARAIGGALPAPRPVRVRQEWVNVRTLRPTQPEANSCIVEAILQSGGGMRALTETSPLVVSRDDCIIDGHHRYHALLRRSRQRRRSAAASVVRVDLPHAAAMRLGWFLSERVDDLGVTAARRGA